MNDNARKTGCLIMATLCWGVAIPFSKMVLPALSPAWLIVLQIAASVAVLACLAAVQRVTLKGIAPAQVAVVALIGMLEPCGAYYLGFVGMQSTSALHTAVIFALEPLGILAFNIALFRFRVDRRLLIAGVVALLGVVVITLGDPSADGHASLRGDAFVFAGVMVAALYVSLSTQAVTLPSATAMLLIQQAGSLLLALVLLGVDTGSGGPYRLPAWPAVWPALAIGVLQFTLAFLFYFRGARDNASYWSVVVLNLIPVVGIAASILILGESASPIYFVGGAITIGAALYTHLRERRTEPGPARA
ncbi:DMT family transporter [Burkholderia sp. Ac-20345]|uniref:DMT family transporter n=1 Tax=Burkholderia sp. Ac-20345 TaxID=2703891 RepID=UPI00197B601B|nr:DMT family transporter [Burkholderia sp. Ac-20345]MBN3784852.1 DMT family transporter [Burkholderia sp. Ac-20345]